MTPRRFILGLAAAVAFALPATAQVALYEGRLPDGFAFVRFANASAQPVDLAPGFTDPVKLGTDGASRISTYRVVEAVAGKTFAATDPEGGKLAFQLTPGKFHTFLVTDAGAKLAGTLVTDVTDYNQLRAKMSFYNAAPACPAASLLLEPANQAIFKAVGPASMRTRSINPVDEAKVHATCGPASVPSLDLGELHAGALYSVWLMAPAGTPVTFVAQDFIAPYQR